MSLDLTHSLSLTPGITMQFRRMVDRGKVGEFWRGSRGQGVDEEARHRVRLTEPYYLGVTPVTQREYRAMASQCLEELSRLEGTEGIEPSLFEGDDCPVEQVNWKDPEVICEWLSGSGLLPAGWKARLPTEAQWEYGCRAGTETEYWSGDGERALAEVGWYAGNSEGSTQPVKQRPANPWGLYDMHGIVWERCRDVRNDDAYRECWDGVRDPVCEEGPDVSLRVLRGCAWSYWPASCRSAFRFGDGAGGRFRDFGFRLCLLPGPVAASPESGAEAGGVRRGTSRKPESHGGASEIDLRAEQGPRPDDPA